MLFKNTINKLIGKFTRGAHAVGKVIQKGFSYITPQATQQANLTGMSRTLALISNEAYVPQNNRKQNINGYELDSELSSASVAIYHNNQNVIIGFRGTKELKDISTDVNILKGTTSDIQFKDAINIYNQVKAKYPNLQVYATGHSKGGSLAIYLNEKFNVPIETFNAGIGAGVFNKLHTNNSILHIIKGDAISNLAGLLKHSNVKIYLPKMKDASLLEAHKMSNFL
jgi:hypothetical protein